MIFVCPGDFKLDLDLVRRAKTMKYLLDHRAADVDSLSGRTLLSMAERYKGYNIFMIYIQDKM